MASYQRLEALLERAGLVGRQPDLSLWAAAMVIPRSWGEEIASELLPQGKPSCKELLDLFREAQGALLATRSLAPRGGLLHGPVPGLPLGLGGGIAWSKEARELLAETEKITTLKADGEEEQAFLELVEELRAAP